MSNIEFICVASDSPLWFTEGKSYFSEGIDHDGYYKVIDDEGDPLHINGSTMTLCLNDLTEFEIVEESGNNQREVEPSVNQTEPVQVATIRSIQEQCSKANLSISIDPEGFNIFDCDTDMQVMVHSVVDVLEILESKLKFKSDMEKYQWM